MSGSLRFILSNKGRKASKRSRLYVPTLRPGEVVGIPIDAIQGNNIEIRQEQFFKYRAKMNTSDPIEHSEKSLVPRVSALLPMSCYPGLNRRPRPYQGRALPTEL